MGIQATFQSCYRDANEPGLQACYEKALNDMFFITLAGSGGTGPGSLSNGNMFSPEQAIIDLEMDLEMSELFGGFEVSKQALGLETVLETKFKGDTIVSSEHTMKHYKAVLP